MSEFEGGYLVYRCRLCGGLNKSIHVPDIRYALQVVMNDMNPRVAWTGLIQKFVTHTCAGGSIGLMEIVGGEPDQSQTGDKT